MRRFPPVVIALTVTAVIAAGVGVTVRCAGGESQPTRAEVIAALKRDPRTADVPDPAAECVADWYLEHASREQLRSLIDGTGAADPNSLDTAITSEAKAAILECLKEAA
jgi:hypothetical protein